MSLTKLFSNLALININKQLCSVTATSTSVNFQLIRNKSSFVDKPKPGEGHRQFRRIIHFPEDGKYTVQPLNTTHMAGRDPVTGRIVCKGIGGGLKHKYHWIDWVRDGPKEGPPQIEKVIEVIKCGCRTADVALVAVGDKLKYILATENMKAGDLIKTSRFIPRIPVRAKEGDAYPLGALPVGTQIHCLEVFPGTPYHFIHGAGNFGTIIRKFGDSVVVQMPTKREFCFKQECMATVGRLSNVEHGSTHIGSAQKNRELGNRPRSGWWQRKTGRHGRKIKKLPPMRVMKNSEPKNEQTIKFTLKNL